VNIIKLPTAQLPELMAGPIVYTQNYPYRQFVAKLKAVHSLGTVRANWR
jgi:hypothetical protein